jgi:hypothetical protein
MRQDNDNREFVHRIDAEERICFVNDAWLAFAGENGWPVSAEQLLGSAVMSHVSDAETRHIYRLLIARVRKEARPIHFRYRCDSPEQRRFLEMRIRALPLGEVEFRSRVLGVERREAIKLLERGPTRRSADPLQICSWCKAVYAHTAWLELEEAVQRLGLLAEANLPSLSHGICPACSDRLTRLGGDP